MVRLAVSPAGNVVFTEIQTDKQGSSRGMGTVQYDKTSDAINAIGEYNPVIKWPLISS